MSKIDHIAILVKSMNNSLKKLSAFGFYQGEINTFQSEGTKEVYLGREDQSARLLLIEAVSEGPYMKACQKRGTGLHHIAINVSSFDDYLKTLEGSGWYLHLHSWQSQRYDTLWLARAGLPLLIELNETLDESFESKVFIKSFQWDFSRYQGLIESLGVAELKKGKEMRFETDGHILSLSDIL